MNHVLATVAKVGAEEKLVSHKSFTAVSSRKFYLVENYYKSFPSQILYFNPILVNIPHQIIKFIISAEN